MNCFTNENSNINENANSKSIDESNLKHKHFINCHVLTEKDFYPPEDKRTYKSGIFDIHGGDNFSDYAKWFYDNYEDELFDN